MTRVNYVDWKWNGNRLKIIRVAPDTELAGYPTNFFGRISFIRPDIRLNSYYRIFLLKTFSINKTCLHFWSLFHSYFLHMEKVLKKSLYMFCCNFICLLFLILNSFSSRISGYPANRISSKRNWISSRIPDIKKRPDIRCNPSSGILWEIRINPLNIRYPAGY